MRFDPLTLFARDLVCSQTGMDFTAAAARGLQIQAAQLPLGLPKDVTWADLFDECEGVVKCRLFALSGYRPTPEEERLRTFVFTHREFFYVERGGAVLPHRSFVVELWPRIDHYRSVWDAQMHEDYWAAAREMRADLKKAGLHPPAQRKE